MTDVLLKGVGVAGVDSSSGRTLWCGTLGVFKGRHVDISFVVWIGAKCMSFELDCILVDKGSPRSRETMSDDRCRKRVREEGFLSCLY